MIVQHKFFHYIIVILLLIQLVIGTPFNISMANEVIDSSVVLENIEPVENTIMIQDTVISYPISDVAVTENNTIITYTESSDTNNTNATPEITINTIKNQEIQTITTDTTTTITYIENSNTESDDSNNTEASEIENQNNTITEIVSENNLSLTQPSLITSTPQKSFVLSGGLIDPLTIDSYNIVDENSDMTFCSYVSYLNLKHITTLSDESLFMRGDAMDIWNKLTFEATLSGYAEVVFTGTHISGSQFIEYLSGIYTTSGSSLFDIVTYRKNNQTIESSLLQFHRFVIFLGSDLERYVLDPIRIDSSDPILLSSYLTEHIVDDEEIKIIQSYTPTDTVIEEDETEEPLTTGHTDDTIVVHSPMEFLPYVLQGLISAPNSGDAISNEVIFHTGFRYETLDGSISAHIPAGLVIRTADGEDFNPFTFTIKELSGNNNELSSGYDDSFKFGIDGQHLVFSSPIGLTLQTPEYEENALLDLMVQHEGQDWNKQGLTMTNTTVCLPDGSVGEEDQLHTAQVQSGKVNFYTCGASSFAFGYVPGLTSPNSAVLAIREQADGKIIIGGTFTTVGGVTRNRIARLNTDKSLDLSFNPNLNNTVNDIKIQSDGKILVAGVFTRVGATVRNRIARLYQDGTVDTSFNPNANNLINDIEIQSDGRILLGGSFTTMGGTARNYAARVSSTGALDTTFNANISTTAIVNSIETQSDGRILLGGTFATVGGVARSRIARVTSTGTLDTTFNPNANNTVSKVITTNGGKIIIGGSFTSLGGVTQAYLAFYDDIILDTIYNVRPNAAVNTLLTQSDGKILIGGAFTTVGGTGRNRIARLNEDNTLDKTFNPNLDGIANSLAEQSDGQILIGGAFTTVGGTARNRIARLNSDGSLDTSFNPDANSTVNNIEIQSDGKILFGGLFTTIGGTVRNRIARVSSTGLLDTTFNPNNTNGTINDIHLLGDNSIIIGGNFTIVDGITRLQISKLSSTGGLDASFNIPISSTTAVNSISMDSKGNLIVGGSFTSLNNNTNNTYFGRIGLNTTLNNLSLWFKANTGTNCTTDGCAISQWTDNSSYSNHAIQITTGAQPIYKSNMINGNPVINFNTKSKYLTSTMTGSYKTVFAVRNLTSTGYQYLFSTPALGDFSIRTAAGFNGTGVLTYTDGPNLGDWSNNGELAIDGKITNTGKTRYHIVKAIASSVSTNTYSISNTLSNRGMYGDNGVAELIVYNTGLDNTNTNKIESYLSIKYGITLDQSIVGGQNYTMSNGRSYWSTGIAGIYDEDIAGIARDDNMDLLQTRSQSINNIGDIIIENINTLNNFTSLLRANNGGSTGIWTTSEISPGISQRIARERHIQEKNDDIGDIIITYPIATGLLATGNLGLMIDTDGDFTNGGTTLITGSIVGGYRTFTTNLTDNSYISFGIVDDGDICIEGPDNFNIGSYTTQNTGQIITVQSDHFTVDDQKGGNDGYYTTLSVSNLTGTSGGNILSSAASIQIRATTIDTLSGTANASVILDTSITSYISANTPVTFIKRNTGAGVGIQGIYGSQIDFRVIIPAYQRADTYTGTITYTLYEN